MLTPYGEWVRAFRESKRTTLREMARTLGRSPSFLSAMELGRKSVPFALIEEITNSFNLTTDEKTALERAASSSRKQTKVLFENKTSTNEREVAMLFARNFDSLTEDQASRIRKILEEGDGKSKR